VEWTTESWPQQMNVYDKFPLYSSMTNFRVRGIVINQGKSKAMSQSEMTKGSASECLQAWTTNHNMNYEVIYILQLCIPWLVMVSHWYIPNKWPRLMGAWRELRLGKTIVGKIGKIGEESEAESQGRHWICLLLCVIFIHKPNFIWKWFSDLCHVSYAVLDIPYL
jgi:hypothetical protein